MNVIFSVVAPVGAVIAALGSILTTVVDRIVRKRASDTSGETVERAKNALVREINRFDDSLVDNRTELIKSDDAGLAVPSLLGQANLLELVGDVQGALAVYVQVLHRAEEAKSVVAPMTQVVVESAAIAASRIVDLSPRLHDSDDAQRALNDATSSLRNVGQRGTV